MNITSDIHMCCYSDTKVTKPTVATAVIAVNSSEVDEVSDAFARSQPIRISRKASLLRRFIFGAGSTRKEEILARQASRAKVKITIRHGSLSQFMVGSHLLVH